MERNYNTYGDLINNKFSELLSADMDTTWKEMKGKLDKEMPESKRKKWLLWFGSKTGILAIVLFTLFASATGTYIGFRQKDKTDRNSNNKKELQPAKTYNTAGEPVSDDHTEMSNTSFVTHQYDINETITISTPAIHKDKTKDTPQTIISKKAPVQRKEAVAVLQKTITLPVKDTVVVSAMAPQTEVVQAMRAF
ncbi:MAG: hypothetical protein JNN00_19610 [Chitinophagaceae bacterium]|nr:hypothetical protein [Chitinophagaceae bacterium]